MAEVFREVRENGCLLGHAGVPKAFCGNELSVFGCHTMKSPSGCDKFHMFSKGAQNTEKKVNFLIKSAEEERRLLLICREISKFFCCRTSCDCRPCRHCPGSARACSARPALTAARRERSVPCRVSSRRMGVASAGRRACCVRAVRPPWAAAAGRERGGERGEGGRAGGGAPGSGLPPR